MASSISAGILVWRATPDGPEFLLAHPGGPFWRRKDAAAWSIPKGLVEPGEDLRAAAAREFAEETGHALSPAGGIALAPQAAHGKTIHAWLVEADLDVAAFVSNTFEIEWPPRSGRRATFPEIDRAAYFDAATAAAKIHANQRPILAEAVERLRATAAGR